MAVAQLGWLIEEIFWRMTCQMKNDVKLKWRLVTEQKAW
jgi:hypothetical protein